MKYIKTFLKIYIIFSSVFMLLFFLELIIFHFFDFSIARNDNTNRPVITVGSVMDFNIFNFVPLLIISTVFVMNKDLRRIGILGITAILLGLIAISINWNKTQ